MRRPAHRRHAATEEAGGLGAAAFDGNTANFLTRPSHASLAFGDEAMSLGCRFRLNAKSNTMIAVGKWDAGTLSNREYGIGYNQTQDRLWWFVVSPFNDQYGAGGWPLGAPAVDTWYDCVGWHDPAANLCGLRIGGTGSTETFAAGFGIRDGSSPFNIGGPSDGAGHMWDGDVDEVFVYSIKLSDAEIDALAGKTYAQLSAGQKTSLVDWWTLNEVTNADTWIGVHAGLNLSRQGTVTSVEGLR